MILSLQKEIRDDWIDNIDWVKVKEQEKNLTKKDDLEDESDEEEDNFDETATYQTMLELMKPGETVSKALRRLGGGKAGMMAGSASARLKAKKMKLAGKEEPQEGDREAFLKLTELANAFVLRGSLEIYQDTYEKISYTVKAEAEKRSKERVTIPDGTNDDDALDMFADDFDKKQGPAETKPVESSDPQPGSSEVKQPPGEALQYRH